MIERAKWYIERFRDRLSCDPYLKTDIALTIGVLALFALMFWGVW